MGRLSLLSKRRMNSEFLHHGRLADGLCFEDMLTRRELLDTAAAYGTGSYLLSGEARSQPPTDLTHYSLVEVAALLRRKAVSPVELTQACLARIERLNPALNAFITITPSKH